MEPREWQRPSSDYAKDWRDVAPAPRRQRARTHPVAWVLLGAFGTLGVVLRVLG